jgi:flagellar hook-length control protein FliK
LGKDAVQVSISMVGNEAQVTFRTDESVTRDALQAASGQLKDMLQREGVLLSGVSIGQSDAGGTKDGQRQSRQGHRHVGQVAASVAAAVAATRPTHGTTGRTVDLFV